MATYVDFASCIRSGATLAGKIEKIDLIIEALEDAELIGAVDADIEEYQLNDGQTIIKTVLRNPADIERTIALLEKRRTKYCNQMVGRVGVLRDKDSYCVNKTS